MKKAGSSERVAGLLLAAGASTRMGRPKQLLPFAHGTLVEHSLQEALKSDLDKIILVLGHKAGEIKRVLCDTLENPKLRVIENRQYHQGISSSILAGLSAVEKTHDHVMILLADMPHIHARLINRLIQHYRRSRLQLGAVKMKGRRSLPVIIGRRFYPQLHKLTGDRGARDIFKKYGDQVCLVEPDFFYDDRDIDTPEDYEKLTNPQ